MTSDKYPQKNMNIVLAHMRDIASAVMFAAEGKNLDQVLERIALVSKELVQARYAALGIPSGKGTLETFKFVGIEPEAVEKIGHLPQGLGLLGAIMNEREILRLEDMSEDPRAVGFPPGHPPMKSLLGVPIQIGNQLFGMLYLTDREDGQPFDEQDQWLIEAMAGYAALAIAGTKLSEQKRRLALLEERERISMELHDSVIQSLYAIGMHLDLIRSADQLEPSDMDTAIDGLNTVIEDIRSYIMNLKTSHYHQQTIRGCLEQLVERLHVPNDIQIEVDAPDVMPPFTLGTFDSICQMANEAVSNAVRHSGADRIEVNAWQDNSHFCVTIRDNGRGFDLSEVKSRGGLGLMNMQNRARIHGGHIHIETGPGKGTCLKIDMPARNR